LNLLEPKENWRGKVLRRQRVCHPPSLAAVAERKHGTLSRA
jgi:hypothetical protein